MNSIHLGENIATLRKTKGITQDGLADFLGVTKASVSKWENGQSCPDVLLIPQIANYFNVTIDKLMGYEPQLAPEQIEKIYQDLSAEFAKGHFTEVVEQSEDLVKQYYSCFPFLLRIALLWFNHYMIAPDQKSSMELLGKIDKLCDHILEGCQNVEIHTQATMVKAMSMLQTGNAKEVIEMLTPFRDDKDMRSQISELLIQAYQMAGDNDSAILFNEAEMYKNALLLVSQSTVSLALEESDTKKCNETIRRVEKLMEIYNIGCLNPNTALIFYYQVALYFAKQGDKNQVKSYLEKFTKETVYFFHHNLTMQSDEYFNHIDKLLEEWVVKTLPRSSQVILDSAKGAFSRPEITAILEENEIKPMISELERIGEKLCQI